ncbi:MAG: UDP-3-O-acyl-N-acetylglucosamine deacetylase [Oligoflexia bacterium]|nr:UDP-3-O-acyl-N-acetylglucosamine deacetylase [Oligoflexia bacterium]
MVYQKTIQKAVSVEGIGLHSGTRAHISFKPAPENTGIYFVRKDISGLPALRAQSRNVRATQMATVLGSELFAISTVEHCMSAIAALQIDNLFIELDGPELPIGDGSANCYFRALQEAAIVEQGALRKYYYVTQPIYFSQGDKYAYALPHNGYRLSCVIDFPHQKIGRQRIELDVNEHTFSRELSTARTFGFLKDVEALKKKGLALGGSLDNAVVLDERDVLNPDGLRYSDEFVRHKAMDAIGDLLMVGSPILGHIVLHKAGHDVMHGFVQKLLSAIDSYRIIELSSPLSYSSGFEDLYLRSQFG